MIDVASYQVKEYFFRDGEKKIYTNNPTQELLTMFLGAKDADHEVAVELINEAFRLMLKDKDKSYNDKLDFQLKCLVVQDYFDFHNNQLNRRFPSTGSKSKDRGTAEV